MENFKIGDKIVRTGSNFGTVEKGKIYTISEILEYGRGIFIKIGIKVQGDTLHEYDLQYFKKIEFFFPKNLKII